MDIQAEVIRQRYAQVQQAIAEACKRSGREPTDVRIVAVTKTVPEQAMPALVQAGLATFGENRWQQARPKLALGLPATVEWHFIGRLQQNKINAVVRHFAWIHSVDSLELLQAIQASAAQQGRTIRCLLQVNISGEASKQGVLPETVTTLTRAASALDHVQVRGLMTMAPLADDSEQSRPLFRQLRQLLTNLQSEPDGQGLHELSMGMSNDFVVAVEEGATIVRIGRTLVGGPPSVAGPS